MIRDIVRLFRRLRHWLSRPSLTAQQNNQPIPEVNDEDVVRIVRRDFPANQFDRVMTILNEYGVETWHRDKKPRVRLAALKLAHGDLALLRSYINLAKEDFRDVLAPAEYPEYRLAWSQVRQMSATERERIMKSDWDQYETWLRGPKVQQVQPQHDH